MENAEDTFSLFSRGEIIQQKETVAADMFGRVGSCLLRVCLVSRAG